MLQIISGTLLAFFAIIGASELLRAAGDFLLKPKKGRVTFIVTPRGHDEQIEYMIRSVVYKAGAFSSASTKPLVIVIDNGMDEETKKICEILSGELGCVEICKTNELPVVLGENLQS